MTLDELPGWAENVLETARVAHLALLDDRDRPRVLPVTFCTVFVVDASGRLETVSAASSYGRTAEQTAARYIAARFDRRDPHMTWLAARALPASPQR